MKPQELTPGRLRAILAVIALSLMTVVSAVSGLNVALPSLAEQTGASSTQMQWIVDAYTVVFAGLLLFSGALGDRFGRKWMLQVGLVIFGAGAALALFTSDPTVLIVARAIMGVGASAIMPTTLSVITTSFPPAERGKAIGVWVGVAGGGAVIGLFASGLLMEFFEWNSFFALNIALAVVSLAGAVVFVPNSREGLEVPLDIIGGFLSLFSVTGLVYGIIEGPNLGWDAPETLWALVIGTLATLLFFTWEATRKHPMLDPRLFLRRGFSTGALSISVQFFAAFGFFFASLQYLQFVVGLSALNAAACMLPMPLLMIPLARQTPRIAAKFGFKYVGALGLLSMALGFLVFSTLTVNFNYWLFLGGLIPFALGMAMAGPPGTSAIIASLPQEKQGVASAVNDTSREMGSAFGIAILGSLITQGYQNGIASTAANLPEKFRAVVENSVAFVQSDRLASLGPIAQNLVETAKEAFVSGISSAFMVAALVLFIGAVLVLTISPKKAVNQGQ
jgi:EmrB/QacA subfamily drug resistance transporter